MVRYSILYFQEFIFFLVVGRKVKSVLRMSMPRYKISNTPTLTNLSDLNEVMEVEFGTPSNVRLLTTDFRNVEYRPSFVPSVTFIFSSTKKKISNCSRSHQPIR